MFHNVCLPIGLDEDQLAFRARSFMLPLSAYRLGYTPHPINDMSFDQLRAAFCQTGFATKTNSL